MININLSTEELLEIRQKSRLDKDFKTSDLIRDELDKRLSFVFDTKEGQEVYHLPEKYFRFKDKFEKTRLMSNRQYVEYRIKEDLRIDKILESWFVSNLK